MGLLDKACTRRKKVDWPVEIPIPSRIGHTTFYYDNGKPCCAIGHLCDLGVWGIVCSSPSLPAGKTFDILYMRIAVALGWNKGLHLLSVNDRLYSKERRLLYLVTWAALGYTNGMPKDVLKLLEEVEKLVPVTKI